MTTTIIADESNSAKKDKRSIANKYLTANLATPVEIMNRHPEAGQAWKCLEEEKANQFVKIAEQAAEFRFYSDYKTYLRQAVEKQAKLYQSGIGPFSGNGFLEENVKPATEQLERMEAEQKPLICLANPVLQSCLLLVNAQVYCRLLRAHHQAIPNGAELLAQAEIEFEATASKLKIPRRTKGNMGGNKGNKDSK